MACLVAYEDAVSKRDSLKDSTEPEFVERESHDAASDG